MSQRPGTILEIVRIDLPRPRDLDIKRDPAFVAYYDAIWKLLRVTSDKDHS
jgi:NitT/TauT family transport system ATP-binding protein